MKKVLILFLIIPFIMSGCSKKSFSGCLDTDFTLNATINYNNLESSATVTRNISFMKITYTSPSTLKGITYTFNDDKLNIDYNKLNCEFENRDEVLSSAAGIIYTCIEDALLKEKSSQINGITENGSYSLKVCDSLPKQLTLDSKKFKCEFSKV